MMVVAVTNELIRYVIVAASVGEGNHLWQLMRDLLLKVNIGGKQKE